MPEQMIAYLKVYLIWNACLFAQCVLNNILSHYTRVCLNVQDCQVLAWCGCPCSSIWRGHGNLAQQSHCAIMAVPSRWSSRRPGRKVSAHRREANPKAVLWCSVHESRTQSYIKMGNAFLYITPWSSLVTSVLRRSSHGHQRCITPCWKRPGMQGER